MPADTVSVTVRQDLVMTMGSSNPHQIQGSRETVYGPCGCVVQGLPPELHLDSGTPKAWEKVGTL